jgi:hypothetical protein
MVRRAADFLCEGTTMEAPELPRPSSIGARRRWRCPRCSYEHITSGLALTCPNCHVELQRSNEAGAPPATFTPLRWPSSRVLTVTVL